MLANNMKSTSIPLVVERTKNGEAVYDIYSRLAKDRILFLTEQVDNESATSLCATMIWLDSQNKKPISLYINSPGGTVQDGLITIYDTMQYIKSPIHTVCIGESYSAAALILAAGDKGNRLAYPHSEIMIHSVQAKLPGGSHYELNKEMERVNRYNDKLLKLISKHSGKTIKELSGICKEDTFLTPEEAIKFGLIDKIVSSTKD
jgi:ATP-dependent Clp protease protease subunit